MHRHTDRTGLIRKRTGYRLPDPPSRICTQFISLCIIKLLYTLDQTKIALLDQIKEAHAAAGIALCNTYYQTQVCLDQSLFCIFIALCLTLCKRQLFLGGKQRYGSDFL